MKLLGVTDDRLSLDELTLHLQQTIPFLDAMILREKSKTDEQLIDVISRLANSGFPLEKLIIHARPYVASKLNLSNVQLPGYGMSVRDARRKFPELTFGCSIHSIEEAKKATTEGADWLLYGHVFETKSKPGLPARGTDELFSIAKYSSIPVYAIGGIQPHHLPDLQRNNVAGAAVLSPMRSLNVLQSYRKGEAFNGEND
ncbi:thiamine phosphate synthase [Sporosarcina sp. P16a]|uniref:thiamine phosphate synthase n=1 Tax=unclassified Sporosarcina TaxID=2647733 RepID=UPI000C170834|nr:MULTISPECIES: thiamine phosphate synthase [unclassified Sporosarcina]PIC67519.1 thiamine phosphate synthase [Sporosarcina sp. P16a]PIC92970.1 thiamine phosphate synthase [Sporosarcina sp. P25]